jgi:hypothetical protein
MIVTAMAIIVGVYADLPPTYSKQQVNAWHATVNHAPQFIVD